MKNRNFYILMTIIVIVLLAAIVFGGFYFYNRRNKLEVQRQIEKYQAGQDYKIKDDEGEELKINAIFDPVAGQMAAVNGRFIGKIKDDNAEGVGVFYFRSNAGGDVLYLGDWYGGELKGKSECRFKADNSDAAFIKGEFSNGAFNGEGEMHASENYIFTGVFLDGLPKTGSVMIEGFNLSQINFSEMPHDEGMPFFYDGLYDPDSSQTGFEGRYVGFLKDGKPRGEGAFTYQLDQDRSRYYYSNSWSEGVIKGAAECRLKARSYVEDFSGVFNSQGLFEPFITAEAEDEEFEEEAEVNEDEDFDNYEDDEDANDEAEIKDDDYDIATVSYSEFTKRYIAFCEEEDGPAYILDDKYFAAIPHQQYIYKGLFDLGAKEFKKIKGIYFGPMQNSKPEGYGIFYYRGYNDRSQEVFYIYAGNFEYGELLDNVCCLYGRKKGELTLLSADFGDGCFYGDGSEISDNGLSFEGEFKNGLKDTGEITSEIYSPEVDHFVELKEGMAWPYIYENFFDISWLQKREVPGLYIGEIKNGVPHGQGIFFHSSNSGRVAHSRKHLYVGRWKNGHIVGKVDIYSYREKEDDFYHTRGFMKNDALNGDGYRAFDNGEVFEGEYRDGLMYNGKYTYGDGSYFIGYLKKDRVNEGKYIDTVKGFEFEGSFNDGQMSYGVIKYNNGEKYNVRDGKIIK